MFRRWMMVGAIAIAPLGLALAVNTGAASAAVTYNNLTATVSCASVSGTATVKPGLSAVNNVADTIAIKGYVGDCTITPSVPLPAGAGFVWSAAGNSFAGTLTSRNSADNLNGCSSVGGSLTVKWAVAYVPTGFSGSSYYGQAGTQKMTAPTTVMTPNSLFGGIAINTIPYGPIGTELNGEFELGPGNGCAVASPATGGFLGIDTGLSSKTYAETGQDIPQILAYSNYGSPLHAIPLGTGLAKDVLTIGVGTLTIQ